MLVACCLALQPGVQADSLRLCSVKAKGVVSATGQCGKLKGTPLWCVRKTQRKSTIIGSPKNGTPISSIEAKLSGFLGHGQVHPFESLDCLELSNYGTYYLRGREGNIPLAGIVGRSGDDAGVAQNQVPWHLGKCNQRLKPAVCSSSLILSHTHVSVVSSRTWYKQSKPHRLCM